MNLSNEYIAKFGILNRANRIADTLGDTVLGVRSSLKDAVNATKIIKDGEKRL